MLAYSDDRTPLVAKILVWLTLCYLLSPIDLIPDFIPVLGMLDDLIIVPLLIKASINLIPEVVMEEARQRLIDSRPSLKANWLFAILIVLVWALVLYIMYRFLKSRLQI